MMDIAVFSDIHGNHVAFRACLDYVLSHDITTFIFLGDYLGEFAYPQKTMEMIYELKEKYNCYFIRGNKEDYWINCKYDNNCEWKDGNIVKKSFLRAQDHYSHVTVHQTGTMKKCFLMMREQGKSWKSVNRSIFFVVIPIYREL